MWRSNSSVYSRTSCPPDIVNEEDHTIEENEKLIIQLINQIQNPELQKEYLDKFKKNLLKNETASVLMCLRDARFKHFKDSILGMITASLYDGPVYFSCYPDLTLDP